MGKRFDMVHLSNLRLYIGSAAIFVLFDLIIGIAAFVEGSHCNAAIFIMMTGACALCGNTKQDYVMRFASNIGEVVMLWDTYMGCTFCFLM